MPLILRKIRKSKWYKNLGVPWLKQEDLQADALGDLDSKDNKLSVWLIEDNRSNLERVITALAAKCDHPTNIDIALLEQNVLDKLDIRWSKTSGDSCDDEINKTFHIDLIELTAAKLLQFAQQIQQKGNKTRFFQKEIIQMLTKGISTGKISRDKIKETLLNEIT